MNGAADKLKAGSQDAVVALENKHTTSTGEGGVVCGLINSSAVLEDTDLDKFTCGDLQLLPEFLY